MESEELEFLVESNAIEGVFSVGAWADALRAWIYAKNKSDEITIETVKGIHYQLLRRIDSQIAGKIRKIPIYVGSSACILPENIPRRLSYWCDKYSKPSNEESIKEGHVEFLNIHPFEDGNGRTGRIIMNLQRIRTGLPILIIHHGQEQQEYYRWFED